LLLGEKEDSLSWWSIHHLWVEHMVTGYSLTLLICEVKKEDSALIHGEHSLPLSRTYVGWLLTNITYLGDKKNSALLHSLPLARRYYAR